MRGEHTPYILLITADTYEMVWYLFFIQVVWSGKRAGNKIQVANILFSGSIILFIVFVIIILQ